jgi:putative hydrolase of the HAD superfamily
MMHPASASTKHDRERIRRARARRAEPRDGAAITWLLDLDDTLHDASHAAFAELHVAMGEYVAAHLGIDAEEAGRLREGYWLRYGATLLGLVRHHGVRAAHFLAETHLLPGLEDRVRTSAHDRAALARLLGRKFIVTNAPRAYAMRVLRTLRLLRHLDGVITIEDMTMFGTLRPKPDARMLRRIAARLKVAPGRCVLVEDTLTHLKAARSIGMRAVWMQRYLGGRFRGTRRDLVNAGAQPLARTRRSCPKPPYLCAKIGALRDLARL